MESQPTVLCDLTENVSHWIKSQSVMYGILLPYHDHFLFQHAKESLIYYTTLWFLSGDTFWSEINKFIS